MKKIVTDINNQKKKNEEKETNEQVTDENKEHGK